MTESEFYAIEKDLVGKAQRKRGNAEEPQSERDLLELAEEGHLINHRKRNRKLHLVFLLLFTSVYLSNVLKLGFPEYKDASPGFVVGYLIGAAIICFLLAVPSTFLYIGFNRFVFEKAFSRDADERLYIEMLKNRIFSDVTDENR